ncbi:MAG: rRNA pseudouridine synthase [Thermodesulfobacteriaceae bacterium]|nr:rRNA pseudouridine synthase [Thermodesulfobacteriaceae bacterium]MDW8135288.1 pseudouridine synthase [Thermodesulfobacterium sp.]
MYLRLDKFLSLSGLGSRKTVSYLIRKGKVKVNSQVVKDPGFKINLEKDIVEVEEQKVLSKAKFYYKMYKPKNYITSTKDPKQVTIMELIPKNLPGYKELFPVGRLDKDAEGLLLLTNDGILAHRILHPKWKIPKIYEVELSKALKEEDKIRLEEGIELSEGKTSPSKLWYLNSERTKIRIEVYEGRYHLIKRMFGKLSYQVLNLKRIAIGNISIGNLKEGELKALSLEEEKELKKILLRDL